MGSPSISKPKKINGFDEWEVKNAASTLAEAEKIKKNPKLLRAAQGVAKGNAIAANETVTVIGQALNQAVKTKKKQAASQKMANKMFRV